MSWGSGFAHWHAMCTLQDRHQCEAAPARLPAEPFGTLLGTRDGVRVYSSNYASLSGSLPTASSLVNEVAGEFTGCRYQCVELARRYLIETRGVTFGRVNNAIDIFGLRTARRISGGTDVRVQHVANGAAGGGGLPRPGSLLIWAPGAVVGSAGHVAVVVATGHSHVDIIEQNWDDAVWPADRPYSRRLRTRLGRGGTATIFDSLPRTEIVGWVSADEGAD